MNLRQVLNPNKNFLQFFCPVFGILFYDFSKFHSNFVPHILLFLVQCAHFHRPHEHNKKEGELSIKSNSNRKPPKSLSESELKKYACIIVGLYLGLDFRVRVRLSLGLVYRFGLGLVYGFGLVQVLIRFGLRQVQIQDSFRMLGLGKVQVRLFCRYVNVL